MKEDVLALFQNYAELALLISIGISILVAVLGVVPSFFITAANILFFGFWQGTAISFAGEAIGAIVAFLLYRKGFKKGIEAQLRRFPKAHKLTEARGREAFLLILSLRLFPFVPSGIVTFAGAVGAVSTLTFFLASSLGKIPALLIEAYSVHQVTQFTWQGKLILAVASLTLLFFAVRQLFRHRQKRSERE